MGEKQVVQCPGCNSRYRVSARFAGRSVACQHCGQRFVLAFESSPARPSETLI